MGCNTGVDYKVCKLDIPPDKDNVTYEDLVHAEREWCETVCSECDRPWEDGCDDYCDLDEVISRVEDDSSFPDGYYDVVAESWSDCATDWIDFWGECIATIRKKGGEVHIVYKD